MVRSDPALALCVSVLQNGNGPVQRGAVGGRVQHHDVAAWDRFLHVPHHILVLHTGPTAIKILMAPSVPWLHQPRQLSLAVHITPVLFLQHLAIVFLHVDDVLGVVAVVRVVPVASRAANDPLPMVMIFRLPFPLRKLIPEIVCRSFLVLDDVPRRGWGRFCSPQRDMETC